MKHPIISLMILGSLLFLQGCISFHKGDARVITPYPPDNFAVNTSAPKTVSMNVRYQLVGMTTTESMRQSAVDNIEGWAQDIFEESGAFHYALDETTSDYNLHMTVRDDAEPNVGMAMLSGFTLGILPAFAKDNFTITVELKDKSGKKLGEKRIKQEFTTVIQILMILGYPVANPQTVEKQMWRRVLTDVAVWAHDQIHSKKNISLAPRQDNPSLFPADGGQQQTAPAPHMMAASTPAAIAR